MLIGVPNTGSSQLSVGSEFEASCDEGHAEPVVVVVSEAAGDSAVQFDEGVDCLGAAVVCAVGVEVAQECFTSLT